MKIIDKRKAKGVEAMHKLHNNVLMIHLDGKWVECQCAYRMSYICGMKCPHFILLNKDTCAKLSCAGANVIVNFEDTPCEG